MTKAEFLEKLRQALNGKVPYTVINENIQYYDEYITVQMRKGETEESVTAALGDPRLLAKTIAGTSGQAEEGGSCHAAETIYDKDGEEKVKGKVYQLPGWLLLVMIILAAVLIISVVGSVVSFLLPILIPLLVIGMLVQMFKRH